jgi:hypothetical protein
VTAELSVQTVSNAYKRPRTAPGCLCFAGPSCGKVRHSLWALNSNCPCATACRFGECGRQQKGECALLHDPSKVAVCAHWLAGSCSAGDQCKRQHKVMWGRRPFLSGYSMGKEWRANNRHGCAQC